MINRSKLMGKIAEAGYSQRSLASALGMSKTTLSNKINGRSFFDTEEVSHLCRELNIVSNQEKIDIFLPALSQNRDEHIS